MTCKDCNPPAHQGSKPPPVVTIPGKVPETRAQQSVAEEILGKDPPAILIELLAMLKNVQVELGAITAVLKHRKVTNEEELNVYRMQINQAMGKQVARAMEQLGRQFSQRPVQGHTTPPNDPRRGPQ